MDVDCQQVVVNHDKIGRITVRRGTPYDKKKLENFLERLSEESIYHRFFRLIKDYKSVVDKMFSDETRLCLLIEREGEVIGCAEVYKTIWPDVGEPAVAILDDYQGMGLGTLLVFLLALCSYKIGVKRFRAYIFKENLPALRIAMKLSHRIIDDYGDSILIEMDLENSVAQIRDYLASRLSPSRQEG